MHAKSHPAISGFALINGAYFDEQLLRTAAPREPASNYGSDVTVAERHFRPVLSVQRELIVEHIFGLTRSTTELGSYMQIKENMKEIWTDHCYYGRGKLTRSSSPLCLQHKCAVVRQVVGSSISLLHAVNFSFVWAPRCRGFICLFIKWIP